MNFIKTIEDKFPIIKNDKIRDILFLIGLSLIVFVETMTTTMFKDYFVLYKCLKIVALVFILIKVVFFDTWNIKILLFFSLCICLSLVVKKSSGYNEVFFWMILLFGARDVDFRKILCVHFTVVFTVIIIAIVASLSGVIENLRYYSSKGYRNSFGIRYPTNFAAYIFFLMVSWFYLLKNKMKWWMYSLGIVIGAILYSFCYTRLDCGCIFILCFLYALISLINPYLENKVLWLRVLISLAIIFLFLLVFFLSFYYDPSVEWMVKIDDLFSSRLTLGKEAFNRYKVNLFGQGIEFHASSGTTRPVDDYFFIDSSYLHVMFRDGIVFIVFVLLVFVLCCLKRRSDWFFLAAVLVIAINATTAHHLTHVQYNPFFMALFAFFPEKQNQVEEKKVLS